MGAIVEGVIALMGLIAAGMVALTALLSGEGPNTAKPEMFHHHSRTIRPSEEPMAA